MTKIAFLRLDAASPGNLAANSPAGLKNDKIHTTCYNPLEYCVDETNGFMEKNTKIIAIIILLVVTAALASYGQALARDSMAAYRSPLAGAFPLPGEPLPAQTGRVVLVVISGLGVENRDEDAMPALKRLEESGAGASVWAQAPSYQPPAWTSLVSGAYPWLNDAPLFDLFPAPARPVTVNTVFENATRQSIKTAVAGYAPLMEFLSADMPDNLVILPVGVTANHAGPVDAAAEALADESIRLLVVQLSPADEVATTQGSTGEAYLAALKSVDAQLDRLAGLIDLNTTTLIVTADYGHIEEGGHGGADPRVLELPLVLAGHKIIPGNYSHIEQIDVAPTISALLGVSLPAANQGRPRLEMLQISDQDRAQTLLALARQRTQLASAYLAWAGLPAADWAEVERAGDFLQAENYAGTEELAQLLVTQADETIRQTNEGRLERAQWFRLAAVLAALTLALLYFRRDMSELWVDALVSGAIVVGGFHLLYLVVGRPYSFSAIITWTQTTEETVRYLLVSGLIGELTFLLFMLLRQCTDAGLVLRGSYEMSLFMALGFLGPVLLAFWQIGPTLTAEGFDISTLFTYLTGLLQTFWAVIIGLFMPAVTVGLNIILQNLMQFIRRRQLEKAAGN